MKRVVIPELLDHLSASDPEALRSRRDLRRINALMGNERWICRVIARHPEIAARGIVEIGAGDGMLCNTLAAMLPEAPISAYDLAPRPDNLNRRVVWHRGDLFAQDLPGPGGVLVANLFLHHFEGQSLIALGRWLRNFDLLLFNEPDRARLPHVLGCLMHPWINRVTRHDMHASITAGFQKGEITASLGLESPRWRTLETCTWRGARRVLGWRR